MKKCAAASRKKEVFLKFDFYIHIEFKMFSLR